MLNKVKVVICGKDFTLQTAESSNYVFGLARTLESRIAEITDANSSASPFTAAIMVGLATRRTPSWTASVTSPRNMWTRLERPVWNVTQPCSRSRC